MKKTFPHLRFEEELWEKGFLVAGIDEVGRGCFAGPLVVGAVVLKPAVSQNDADWILSLGINDSKLVTPKKRKLIYKVAQELILYSSLQYIPVSTINAKGVGFANKLGFEKAALNIVQAGKTGGELPKEDVFFLTDAFKIPGVESARQKNIIRGDSTSISIALASILAKVERDTYMEKLANEFPLYGFEKNKGYGTLFHRTKLREHGACPHHRTDFIQNYI